MMTGMPNCLQCINYFITHDPARPYGCKAWGFKSRMNPARLVYVTSGIHCQLFSPRKRPGEGSGSSRAA